MQSQHVLVIVGFNSSHVRSVVAYHVKGVFVMAKQDNAPLFGLWDGEVSRIIAEGDIIVNPDVVCVRDRSDESRVMKAARARGYKVPDVPLFEVEYVDGADESAIPKTGIHVHDTILATLVDVARAGDHVKFLVGKKFNAFKVTHGKVDEEGKFVPTRGHGRLGGHPRLVVVPQK